MKQLAMAVRAVCSAVAEGIEQARNPRRIEEYQMHAAKLWQHSKFPTGIRFLYLKSITNQNEVTTIGYRFLSCNEVQWQFARCNAKAGDIFSRRIARDIIQGRLQKFGWIGTMRVKDKGEMYNKFIAIYHPDRSYRHSVRKLVATPL